MNRLTIKRVMGIALVGTVLLTRAAAAQSLQVQREALNLIGDFADRFCKDIPLAGGATKFAASASVKAELVGLLKKLAGLGIGAAAEYQQQGYEGLLQTDLVRALEAGLKCRMQIWNDLKERLVFSPSPTQPPAPTAPSRTTRVVEADAWELVRTENFTNPAPGWPTGSWRDEKSEGTVSQESGVLRVDGVFEDWMRKWDLPYAAGLDIKMDIDIRFLRADHFDDKAGVLFARARRTELQYMLQRNGWYTLTQQTDGGRNDNVLEWVRSGAVTNEWNRLQIEVVNQTITLRLNGSVAARYRDVSYGGGTVGLFVGAKSKGNISVQFDNFALYRKR